jgi:hypothetical protein
MEDHLYRTADGGIMWQTELGKWMFNEAFKFDERQNSIKLLWNLNRLSMIIDQLVLEAEKHLKNSKQYKMIMSKAREYSLKYVLVHKDLMEYYN